MVVGQRQLLVSRPRGFPVDGHVESPSGGGVIACERPWACLGRPPATSSQLRYPLPITAPPEIS